jgi:hypothetical protein
VDVGLSDWLGVCVPLLLPEPDCVTACDDEPLALLVCDLEALTV